MDYKQFIKDETFDYAIHFYEIYRRKVEKGESDFKQHVKEDCKFDNDFLLSVMSHNMTAVAENMDVDYQDLMDDDEVMKKVIKQFRSDMMEEMKKYYFEKLQEEIEEVEEDLKFSIEDEEYYENRKYIGEEEVIGGKVSEEERISLIEGERKKQEQYKAQLELLYQAREQVQTKTSAI